MKAFVGVILSLGLASAVCGQTEASIPIFEWPAYRVSYFQDWPQDFLAFPKTTDFLFDYESGFIWNNPSMFLDGGSGKTRILSLNLSPRYQLRQLPGAGQNSASAVLVPTAVTVLRNKPVGFRKEELFISGQKSFGLSYSPAGEAEFQQSLSLALKGKLSERVGFSANLSDRNLPSGSGAFSKRLEQFDQVGFAFNFPQGNLSLGDVFFKAPAGAFLNFERKVSGLGFALHSPRESLTVALGSGPGEFRTVLLAGQEGKQGPYYFAAGRSFIVSGSEKVYLDGELLNSGREADYEVDYERSSITFTPRRAVSSFSRIRVEYEFQGGPYAKNITAAHSATRLAGGNVKLRVGYLSAGDKMDSPLLAGLSSAEKERLAAAGGDPSAAVRNGAVFVGKGKGDYTAFLDSSGIQQYRYVGHGAGDYTVSFSLVQSGTGDYRYLGAGIYEYVGKGRGGYLPVLYLPMPGSEAGTSLGLEFGPESFLGFVEGAFSQANLNLFSRRPGVKNNGSAIAGGVRWQSSDTPSVKVEARLKRREAGFRYLGQKEENEAAYRWNLLPGEENQSQTQGELSLAANWGWGQGLFNLGGLALPNGRRNGLGESEISLSPAGWLTLNSRTEAGRSSVRSGHYRTKNSATGRWGSLAVTSSVEREKGNPFLGQKLEIRQRWNERVVFGTYFLEASFGNRAGYRSGMSAASGAAGWGVLSRFAEIRLGSAPIRTGENLTTEGTLGWRRTEENGRNFGKAYFFLKNSYLDGGKRLVFSHELSPVAMPSEIYSYFDVGTGNGSFRYENGGYMADPYGNFTLVSEAAGETLSVYRVRQNWEAGWEPYRSVPAASGFWSRVSYRASLSFDGDFVHPKEGTAVFPVFGLSESRRHELEFGQTFAYSPETHKARWEILWQEKNSKRSYLNTAGGSVPYYAGSVANGRKLDFSASFYGQKLTQNYTLQYLQKNSSSWFWSPFKIRGAGFKTEWLYAFNRTVALSLGGRLYRDKEQITGRPSLLAGSAPKLIFSFPGKGRFEAGLGIVQVFNEPVSFEQAEGNLKGINLDYSLNLEYRLGPKLSASASFLGSRRPRLGRNERASTHLSYLF